MHDKCSSCYRAAVCMLSKPTRKHCGGPWKDRNGHLRFVEKELARKNKAPS